MFLNVTFLAFATVRSVSGVSPPTVPLMAMLPVPALSVRLWAPFTVLLKVTFPPVPSPALPPLAVIVVFAERSVASATLTLPPAPAVPVPERFPPVVEMFRCMIVGVAPPAFSETVPPLPPLAFPARPLPPTVETAPTVTLPPVDVVVNVPPLPPARLAPFPLLPFAVIVVAVRLPAPVSEIVPALRPAVLALAVPPDVVIVVRVVVPLVDVTETFPPAPFACPVVVSAPELTVVPARVMEPATLPAPVPVAAPVLEVTPPGVASVPVPVIETTLALPPT